MKIHIVQLGDTLWKLAEKYNASFEELKKVNSHLADPEKLMPGMKIKIPGSKKAVQKSTSKNEQMTPKPKIEKNSKKEQMTPVSKEETKAPKKEQKKPVQKEEQKKEEHPYKQKTPTPIAVLKEDDQKEKKKEQFEAVMPKMPQMPQAPTMPILKKEMKTEKKTVPAKIPKPPKPKEHKQEKTAPVKEQQPANKAEPQTQAPEQQQPAFDFETYQQPAAMPCEPMPFFPQMMPIFYMPCPPMQPPVHHYHPHPVHPGMQQGFPMMPPMGDCGCGGQNQFPPMQGSFNPVPAGFNESQFEAGDQQFQGMMPYQQQTPVNETNQQASLPEFSRSENNHTLQSNQNTDNEKPLQSNKANPLPTSASFMENPGQSSIFNENRHYFQPHQAPLSNSHGNTFYPKPPFYPEQPDDKHDSSS